MNLYLVNHDYRYAVEQIMLMMFPEERPVYDSYDSDALMDKPSSAHVILSRGREYITASCRIVKDGVHSKGLARVSISCLTGSLVEDRLLQRIIKLSFYRAAINITGKKPVWGALTGIRPGKIVSSYLESGMSEKKAVSRFIKEYDVSRDRAGLCLKTAKAGLETAGALDKNHICLYVGIPFCPSRCTYCSFVSQSVEKSMSLIPPFLECLLKEIEETAKTVHRMGLKAVSLYIGGGTPTTLSAPQLDMLCGWLSQCFDFSDLHEYTVEAGRPDTITMDKLEVLSRRGVNRISVNPQSMEDDVLGAIGRRHSSRDVSDAVAMVRRFDSFSLNMDLIAGLPLDSVQGFNRTLDKVLKLAPENVTVHTLALKKGSKITLEGTRLPDGQQVGQMLDSAFALLNKQEYEPYYLYRQKFTSGGFENVGFCKKGFKSIYNICIMEELCSIISMGGGASSKLVTGQGRIERIFNPKYPREYIDNIDKVISDKRKIEELLF